MADLDCGFCARLASCGGRMGWSQFPTFAARLLCDIWGKIDEVNTSVGNIEGGVGGGGTAALSKVSDSGAGVLSFAGTGDTLEVDMSDWASLSMQIFGTFAGTAIFEYSLGTLAADEHWTALTAINDDGDIVSGFTAPGTFHFRASTLQKIRARVTVAGSGSASYITSKSTANL